MSDKAEREETLECDNAHDRVNEYATSVSQQLRWGKARLRVIKEINHHIIDGRDAYIKQGLGISEATDKAIADTGDPIHIGAELDRIHRPKPQWAMFAWAVGFMMLGFFISIFIFGDTDMSRRLVLTSVGFIAMVGAYFADFTLLGKYPRTVCIIVGVLVLIAHNRIIGSHILVLNMAFELQTLALLAPVVFAPIIYTSRNKGYRGMIISLVAYALLCIATIAVGAHRISGFVHFAIIGAILLIIAVIKNWFNINKIIGLFIVIAPPCLLFGAMLFTRSLSIVRLTAAFNPSSDPLGFGFLATQIRATLGGALILGEGVVSEFLPISDLTLLMVVSRFGWLAFAAIAGVLLLFMAKVIAKCMRQNSELGFFVSIAIALTLFVQIFMYVIFNLGFTITYISLPLISPNNSAMVVNMVLIGFMLSVFRTGDIVSDADISNQDLKLVSHRE